MEPTPRINTSNLAYKFLYSIKNSYPGCCYQFCAYITNQIFFHVRKEQLCHDQSTAYSQLSSSSQCISILGSIQQQCSGSSISWKSFLERRLPKDSYLWVVREKNTPCFPQNLGKYILFSILFTTLVAENDIAWLTNNILLPKSCTLSQAIFESSRV